MNINDDLLGKTITGVIAHRSKDNSLREIWVMQFDDGSHVEFVSPKGLQALRRAANQERRKSASGKGPGKVRKSGNGSARLTDSRSLHYQREVETGAQLVLNVA